MRGLSFGGGGSVDGEVEGPTAGANGANGANGERANEGRTEANGLKLNVLPPRTEDSMIRQPTKRL